MTKATVDFAFQVPKRNANALMVHRGTAVNRDPQKRSVWALRCSAIMVAVNSSVAGALGSRLATRTTRPKTEVRSNHCSHRFILSSLAICFIDAVFTHALRVG